MNTNYHYDPTEDAQNRANGEAGAPPYDVTVIPLPPAAGGRFRALFGHLPRVGHDAAGYIIHSQVHPQNADAITQDMRAEQLQAAIRAEKEERKTKTHGN